VRSISSLILFGIKRNFVSSGMSQSYLFTRRVMKEIVVIIEACLFCQLHTKFYPNSCQGLLHMQRKLLGIISVGFDVTGELLMKCSAFVKCFRKKQEYSELVHQLLYL
jgi:hypothetical protein